MFNIFTRRDREVAHLAIEIVELKKRLTLLERTLDLEYFAGSKNRPHYRRKRSNVAYRTASSEAVGPSGAA